LVNEYLVIRSHFNVLITENGCELLSTRSPNKLPIIL